MSTEYQKALNARLSALPLVEPPAPWRLVTSFAVGGFEALGFSPDSNHLLVVSSSGRAVLDATTGKRLARDSAGPGSCYDLGALAVEGIGPLSGEIIQVAGIHGGGLPTLTLDGWVAHLLSPNWPSSFVALSAPGSSPWIADQAAGVARIAPTEGYDAVQTFGFSWSRRNLVVATGDGVELFVR